MDIFRESRPFCATGCPTPTSGSAFHHRRRRYGQDRIGRAFLTMHRILDKENQIHTDMALALPAVVKDAVAIWADMDALDRCSGTAPLLPYLSATVHQMVPMPKCLNRACLKCCFF
ncbi:hypothetical protein E5O45_001895 [Neisseria gonorrhoeae]